MLADRDLIPLRDAGDVSGDRVIERELALILEQQQRGGGELLRDRSDLIGHVGARGCDVGRLLAPRPGEDDFPAAHDRYRGRRDAGIGERRGDERVDLLRFFRRQRLRERGGRAEQRQRGGGGGI